MQNIEANYGFGLPDEVHALLPARLDRRRGAEIISKYFFPISARTLEVWPLTWRRVNGRALVETNELLAYAQAKLSAATPIRGGKRKLTAASWEDRARQ